MRTVYDLRLAVGAVLVPAAVLAAAGCGSLDRSVSRDHCLMPSDCNRGRVCLAGICQAPTDAAAEAPVYAPEKDALPGVEAGFDAAADPPPSDLGSEASNTPPADAEVDAPDERTGADAGADVPDAPPDGAFDVENARETGTGMPPDPGATGPGQEATASTAAWLAALSGLW